MNQPRYRDNSGGNSWHNNPAGSNRRNVHSTGRSNYGGSGGPHRGGRNKQQGNPIGNWIQNRRERRLRRQRSSTGGAVGTEANAIQNMEKNAKHFDYPKEGFVTPIEHSLLYAMIEFPERYPEGVVKSEIEDEDFVEYLYIKDEKRKGSSTSDREGGENADDDEEGSDHAHATTSNGGEEQRVSYAQLSAIASLSAEKNPAIASSDQDRPAASTSQNSQNPPSRSNSKEETLTIGQTLVRKLLRVITRYSDAHSLDRQTEIREFLAPIEKRCQMRNEKAALQQLLPAYAGYTLSLMTGNPLPLLIGAAALTGPDPMLEENSNVSEFRAVGGRVGDVETAGLLDECESD